MGVRQVGEVGGKAKVKRIVILVPRRQHPHMSSIASPTTERTTAFPETSGVESATPMQRVMSVDALRGMDMFFIVGMEEVFEALSEMFPMSPSLNDRLQHAPWAGFHFYDTQMPPPASPSPDAPGSPANPRSQGFPTRPFSETPGFHTATRRPEFSGVRITAESFRSS